MITNIDDRKYTLTLINIDKRIHAVIDEVVPGRDVGLKYLQKHVKGTIEHINLSYYMADLGIGHLPIDMWCNDEGRILHMIPTIPITYNGDIIDMICGPVVFTSVDEDIGETYALTKAELDYLIDRLKRYYIKYLKHNISVSRDISLLS